jgi:hypothetical protein
VEGEFCGFLSARRLGINDWGLSFVPICPVMMMVF